MRPRREGTTWVSFFAPLCRGSMLRSVTRRRRHRFEGRPTKTVLCGQRRHTPRRGKEAHQPPAESECIPVAVVEENILTLQLFRTPSYFLEVWKELLKHSTRLSLFWRRLQ